MMKLRSYFFPVTFPIFNFAYASSILTSLFLTIERYLAICQQTSISMKKTKKISFILILICAIITSPFGFFYTWKSNEIFSGNGDGNRRFLGNYTVAITSEFYSENLKKYWDALTILLFVLPLILFLVFNILIIRKVRKSI